MHCNIIMTDNKYMIPDCTFQKHDSDFFFMSKGFKECHSPHTFRTMRLNGVWHLNYMYGAVDLTVVSD